ncbi:MAG: outer membrane lipoprotein carrier protein LolA [Marinilabiliales bacterium]|nr:MAG: outer membrane lipoprotein carrier protein LolA [Marinilabiliales bacterium]
MNWIVKRVSMRKLISFIITILLLNPPLTGVTQDEKAAEILDGLSDLMNSAPSVKIDFTFIITDLKDGMTEEIEGNIVMKDNKYRLETMEMVSWFDGSSVYTYMPDVNELMISDNAETEDILSNPVNLFSIYREKFRYRLIGETSQSGKTLYEVDLHPLDLDQAYHTIKLFIEKDKKSLHSAVVAAKDGSRYTLLVDKFDDRHDLPDDFFSFTKDDYPGVEVIDMRW